MPLCENDVLDDLLAINSKKAFCIQMPTNNYEPQFSKTCDIGPWTSCMEVVPCPDETALSHLLKVLHATQNAFSASTSHIPRHSRLIPPRPFLISSCDSSALLSRRPLEGRRLLFQPTATYSPSTGRLRVARGFPAPGRVLRSWRRARQQR